MIWKQSDCTSLKGLISYLPTLLSPHVPDPSPSPDSYHRSLSSCDSSPKGCGGLGYKALPLTLTVHRAHGLENSGLRTVNHGSGSFPFRTMEEEALKLRQTI